MVTVTVNPEIEERIREQIAVGNDVSIDKAIEDAVAPLEERERAR